LFLLKTTPCTVARARADFACGSMEGIIPWFSFFRVLRGKTRNVLIVFLARRRRKAYGRKATA
jgi:hypothetical protein